MLATHASLRILAPLLVALALVGDGCGPRGTTAPLAPAGPPASGSEFVAPAASTSAAAQAPVLLRADDVDDALSARIGPGRVAVPYLASDAWMGAELPTVTLVAFIDYQCPFSRRLATTLYELVARYPDDVRVVFKHLPLDFHANARLAAEAVVVAQRQGRFWPMHDAAFAGQADLGLEALVAHAGRLGLAMPQFRADLEAHTAAEVVDRDLELAKSLHATATPTSYANGRKLSGALPMPELVAVVDEEIALARELLAAGAHPHELYARVLRAGEAAPVVAPSPTVAATTARPGRPDPALAYAVPAADRHARGPDDALVTIVEFADFQCPFCKRATATLEDIAKAHPDDVRLVFRHMPLAFHEHARAAARAAVAAGNQGKFWEMHDLLFQHAKELDGAKLRKLAKQLRLNIARFTADLESAATDRIVDEDLAIAQRFGVTGTPSFFINGRFLGGAQQVAAFEALIEAELPKARAHRERVAPPEGRLYESMIQTFKPGLTAAGSE